MFFAVNLRNFQSHFTDVVYKFSKLNYINNRSALYNYEHYTLICIYYYWNYTKTISRLGLSDYKRLLTSFVRSVLWNIGLRFLVRAAREQQDFYYTAIRYVFVNIYSEIWSSLYLYHIFACQQKFYTEAPEAIQGKGGGQPLENGTSFYI